MKNTKLTMQTIGKISAAALLLVFTACKKEKDDDIVVVQASGNITSAVDQFRQLLGATLNTTPGAVGGRREVNWEGVPADLLGQPLPSDFFNTIGDNVPAARQRGLTYAASAGGFMVSNTGFAEVNSTAAGSFSPFSGDRMFANTTNSLWEIRPKVPGKVDDATIRGFGIVFSDVDLQQSTFMEFFDGDKSLGKFYAPVHDGSSGFSFLGVYFKTKKLTSVRIGHDGKLADGGKDISDGGSKDLVAMDDFLYDEPVKKQ